MPLRWVFAGSLHDTRDASPGPLPRPGRRTYVRPTMERQYELESLRRSLAMLRPGAPALDREEAMRLVRELQELEHQLRSLRQGLQRLLAESGSA